MTEDVNDQGKITKITKQVPNDVNTILLQE